MVKLPIELSYNFTAKDIQIKHKLFKNKIQEC